MNLNYKKLVGKKSEVINLYKKHKCEQILVLFWIPIGAVFCYSLTIYGGFDSVLSAGITGLLGSFLPTIKKQSIYLKKLPPAIYCGAFVGMSNVNVMPSICSIVFAGLFTGIFYLLFRNLFLGFGGRLGTIAFIGVMITLLIRWLLE